MHGPPSPHNRATRSTDGCFRSLCRENNVDQKSHEALKLDARLLDECDWTESIEELSQRFAA